MNITETSGESSCNEQENGDACNGSERPLKKARFAWQVKGKYHLKNEISDSLNASGTTTTSSPSETATNNMGSEQNLEILGDYLLKQDFNTLDSVITDTDKSLLTPSSSVSNATLPYPRYVSSYDNESCIVNRITERSCETISLPISAIISQKYMEDQCIARWQARQMAKGFVDNRINHVLDSWIRAPSEEASGFLALEVAEFINNLPGDNSVENEGILMAISAHGLQNTTSSSNPQASNCENNFSLSDDEETERFSETHKCEEVNDLESTETNNLDNDRTEFSLFSDSSLSYQCVNENNVINEELDEASLNENPYDFILDEAVLLAINSKGLTTLGTDYG